MADSSTRTSKPADTVFALMAFTVVFSLLGHELKAVGAVVSSKGLGPATGLTTGGRIIAGGFIATSLLTLLTHAGEGGQKVAVGLAWTTFLTATLVEGGIVWTGISNVLGGKAAADKSAASSGTSSPSIPSSGTSPDVLFKGASS